MPIIRVKFPLACIIIVLVGVMTCAPTSPAKSDEIVKDCKKPHSVIIDPRIRRPQLVNCKNNTSSETVLLSPYTKHTFSNELAQRFLILATKIKKNNSKSPNYNLEKGLNNYFNWIKKVTISDNLLNYHPFKL